MTAKLAVERRHLDNLIKIGDQNPSDFPYLRFSTLNFIVMSLVERALLVSLIIIVALGAILYLTHPQRSWIKKLQKKLAASVKHSKKMPS